MGLLQCGACVAPDGPNEPGRLHLEAGRLSLRFHGPEDSPAVTAASPVRSMLLAPRKTSGAHGSRTGAAPPWPPGDWRAVVPLAPPGASSVEGCPGTLPGAGRTLG